MSFEVAGVLGAGGNVDIGGAILVAAEPRSWLRLSMLISDDGLRLVCTYQVGPAFRVKFFQRDSGLPQWRGEWWAEARTGCIAETNIEADGLAQEYLHAAP
jgi:hypothetical protein